MELKQNIEPQVYVVMTPYHVSFDEQNKPSLIYECERLLKNGVGFRCQKAVHEAIAPQDLIIIHSNIVVEHRKLKLGDAERNLRIFKKQLASGVKLGAQECFYYARELYYHNQYEDTIKQIEEFLSRPDARLENRLDSYRMLAASYEAIDKSNTVLQTLLRSLAEDTPRAETCCESGRHFIVRKAYAAAVFWYEAAASRQKTMQSGAFIDSACYDYIPYIQSCVCHYWLGNMEKARQYHHLAAALKPEAEAVQYNEIFFASK